MFGNRTNRGGFFFFAIYQKKKKVNPRRMTREGEFYNSLFRFGFHVKNPKKKAGGFCEFQLIFFFLPFFFFFFFFYYVIGDCWERERERERGGVKRKGEKEGGRRVVASIFWGHFGVVERVGEREVGKEV